jgi:thioredoxin reductase (NADPH)
MMSDVWEAVIVGGGLAGLSAGIYLGRSRRRTLLVHSDHSMAKWEPDVQNYLGFPAGVAGSKLLALGREQAARYGTQIANDEIRTIEHREGLFEVTGSGASYRARRVLLATGLTHVPPDVPGVKDCLGRSLFFCKDCDAYRVQGRRIAVIGWNEEAARTALGMLQFSPHVMIATHGRPARWDARHDEWLREYAIPVDSGRLADVDHIDGRVRALVWENGARVEVDAVFTMRGDIYHTDLAVRLGARTDEDGQLIVDDCLQTTLPGLYAAGCVTPANCQMIIAAGQGAAAAQAINRDLFMEGLRTHTLRRWQGSKETVSG